MSAKIESVCEEAQRIVYGDREKTYDHPARNFERTALLWNAHIEAKYGSKVKLDVHDVAWMMMQLKQAREIHQHKRDNIVDAIGYIACDQKMIDFADGVQTGNSFLPERASAPPNGGVPHEAVEPLRGGTPGPLVFREGRVAVAGVEVPVTAEEDDHFIKAGAYRPAK
jgi:hypothetical protein